MSSTRPKFDNFHQQDDMRITSYSVRYQLDKPEHNCPSSFPAEPSVRLQYSGASWPQGQWKTDIESDLFNINRLGNRVKNNDIQYNPETNKMNNTPLSSAQDLTLGVTYQRLYNPPCTLRATGWNRWEHLHHNPQDNFETPFDFFIPSRTQSKDAWVKQSCISRIDSALHPQN
jgi:hypothetical protein